MFLTCDETTAAYYDYNYFNVNTKTETHHQKHQFDSLQKNSLKEVFSFPLFSFMKRIQNQYHVGNGQS